MFRHRTLLATGLGLIGSSLLILLSSGALPALAETDPKSSHPSYPALAISSTEELPTQVLTTTDATVETPAQVLTATDVSVETPTQVLTATDATDTNANPTTPQPLKLYSTIQSVGVVSPFSGDGNKNGKAALYYRVAGSAAWLEGHVMAPDYTARQWRASLFFLNPNTAYEVEVRFTDPDGMSPAKVSGTVRTRPDYPAIGGSGVVRTVPTDGNLQAVIRAAQPGDTIRLLAGVYHVGDIDLNEGDSGASGNYVTIEPAPNAAVVLDGSDEQINSPGDDWTFYRSTARGDIYYTDLAWGSVDCEDLLPGYVGESIQQKSVRYLLFESGTGDWANDFLVAAPGKAYYVCDGNGPGPKKRLYVTTYSGDDPDNHDIQISRYTMGFNLKGTDYVRIRGLEFQYYGRYSIHLNYSNDSGADANIVEGNTFHNIGRGGVRLQGPAEAAWTSNNLIQNNTFYETGYRDSGWSWEQEYQRGRNAVIGVMLNYAGHGNVVRGNTIKSGHDGISVDRSSNNVDVYNNTISECMDDGIEVDGDPGQNVRIWGNVIKYCYTLISMQDWNAKSLGPVYIFRNVLVGGDDPKGRTDYTGDSAGYSTYTAFKVGADLNSESYVYLYHNTVSVLRSGDRGNGITDSGGVYFGNAVTRNNIWRVSSRPFRLNTPKSTINHDFDCDNLHKVKPDDASFVQWSSSGGPSGNGSYRNLSMFRSHTTQEQRGISDTRTAFNSKMELMPSSPDIDAGCVIKGFNDQGANAYQGTAPDLGAFEAYGFSLTVSPIAYAIEPGDVVQYTIVIQAFGGFNETVNLTVGNAPSKVTLELNKSAIAASGQAVLTLRDAHAGPLPQGLYYAIPITASGGKFTRTVNIGVLIGGLHFYMPVITRDDSNP